jgi:TolB protein
MLAVIAIFSFTMPVSAMPGRTVRERYDRAQGCAWLVIAGTLGDNWEIVMLDREQRRILNLTRSPDDERAPAWSPDGTQIAFEARRAGNWDVYAITLATGALHRLTDSPAYEGQPAWSPDGTRIAFESNRDGNLEIYTMPAQGGSTTRVTTEPAADVEPAWTADTRGLIVGSWRSGARQLYRIDLITGASAALTEPGEEAREPALSPDGRRLAYVRTGGSASRLALRDMISGAVTELPGNGSQRQSPTWLPFQDSSPFEEQPALLTLDSIGASGYHYPTGWNLRVYHDRQVDSWSHGEAPELPGQWQHPACAPAGNRAVRGDWQPIAQALRPALLPVAARVLSVLPGVRALQPRLAAAVADSFRQLRRQTLAASGHDFLAVLNDAWRGLDHPSGTYLSWHKTGRAFDLRDWYAAGGQRILFIAREVFGGQTYFRIYLRAARQDGTQGAPLRESLWETSGRLSNPTLASTGGQSIAPPGGYFVDFTDLAERTGWTRIPALTPPEGDWRRNYRDLEFWHYERRDGLSWFAAMQQIYDDDQLRARFSPKLVLAHGHSIEDVLNAGIPGAARQNDRAARRGAIRPCGISLTCCATIMVCRSRPRTGRGPT